MLLFPVFGFDLPRSFNYGGIGSVIGHEITHGFDNSGKDFDENGNMRRWLSEEWQKSFEERATCFVEQYNNTPVLHYTGKKALKTNLTNNGTYTLKENIADYGGVQLALKAWRNRQSIYGSEPRFDAMQDFSNEQAFFIGYATLT
ncbi:peptidase family M13 [Ancylostoma ceylanicum]|uniref:Peptidase family M13 n=1 Tax=Ancylostoma ceylanicum TaxID=53326 RepID=A0A0D6LPA1_9BILA|nr:peptidase family M13 [Ancylostoma ceylanicum]